MTRAVRWLHSLVTSMIARIGSRNDVIYAAMLMKSPKSTGSDCTRVMTVAVPSIRITIRPIPTSSQKPARVSRALRSSTATSRVNGTRLVADRSR